MRVWKLSVYSETDKAMHFVWFTSKEKLEEAMKAARTDGTYIDFESLEIDCTRRGLVEWLNRHVTSDAGARNTPTALRKGNAIRP
jgi:hypothetical protein